MKHAKHVPTDSPVMPKKMPPMLNIDLEEIEGAGDLEFGDTVVLIVKGKVTSLSTSEHYMGGAKTTRVELKLSSVKLDDNEVRTHKQNVGGLT